MKYLTPY